MQRWRRKTAEEYYDELEERLEESAWWRIALRYAFSVAVFILFLVIALAGYWTWMDYSPNNFRDLTIESWLGRAAFRWNEFTQGRVHVCGTQHC